MNRQSLSYVCILCALTSLGITDVEGSEFGHEGLRPHESDLINIAPNEWTLISDQTDGIEGLKRQGHAGACFDRTRGRVMMFGSDTHRRGWLNSVDEFDPGTRSWFRYYKADAPEDYVLDEQGFIRSTKGRPPPQHTYGAVECVRGKLMVFSKPKHKGDFSASKIDKRDANRWPTWVFDPQANEWTATGINEQPPTFFASTTVYDSDRHVVVGLGNNTQNKGFGGTWEFHIDGGTWMAVDRRGFLTGGNGVYDTVNRRVLVFGLRHSGGEVMAYSAEDGWETMETPGIRPTPGTHVPLAFDSDNGVMIAVVDRPNDEPGADTWVYNYQLDSWLRVPTAGFPSRVGMNYMMIYDSWRRVFILIASGRNNVPVAWALRYVPSSQPAADGGNG